MHGTAKSRLVHVSSVLLNEVETDGEEGKHNWNIFCLLFENGPLTFFFFFIESRRSASPQREKKKEIRVVVVRAYVGLKSSTKARERQRGKRGEEAKILREKVKKKQRISTHTHTHIETLLQGKR